MINLANQFRLNIQEFWLEWVTEKPRIRHLIMSRLPLNNMVYQEFWPKWITEKPGINAHNLKVGLSLYTWYIENFDLNGPLKNVDKYVLN